MRRHRLLTHTDANTHSEIYARMYVHTHTQTHTYCLEIAKFIGGKGKA